MNDILSTIRRRMAAIHDDSGMALVTVLGLGALLTILMFAATGFAVNQQKQVRGDQDWNSSLAAAEAGVDDYISKLNADGTYWRYGNPANSYSATSTLSLPTGTAVNTAFSGWTAIPGTTTRGYFRYDIDNSQFTSQGILKLRSSGKVGSKVRSVEVQIRRRGFIDYLYFTDFDTKDPAAYETIVGDSYTATQAETNCHKHSYEGRVDKINGVNTGCTSIRFIGSGGVTDVIQGPLHTNDSFYTCGAPQFQGATSTSWNDPAGKRYRKDTSCSGTPVFSGSGDPKYASQLTMPPSNNSIRQEVDPTRTNPVGCLYTGPTSIVLTSVGKMNVSSPWTKNGGAAYCGVGNGLSLPANGVIYVQSVPATADAYTNSSPTTACKNSGAGNPLGYPQTNDISKFPCNNGDVFIEGTLKGQLSIAAENNIVITWHLDYAGGSSGTDLLGLMANNYVEIYHPIQCTSYSGAECVSGTNLIPTGKTTTFTNSRVNAAVLSVNHSFRVENYRWGTSLGTLNITGALAQRYRGIVGSGSAGFAKNYVYDARLRYASPPKFLDPVQSAYQPSLWSEPSPAYTS
ncbi:MAG: pilus assembly PilX N-terminal domain-containing protein [Actinomycetes bacterium]